MSRRRRSEAKVLQSGRPDADTESMRIGAGGSRHRNSRCRSSRGATLVEYALIISILVFGSVGAISGLDDASGNYYATASDDIGDLPQSNIDTSDNGTVPASTSSTTSTTAAPSTTSTTTTSTTAPTTTTTTTTTTTPTTTTTIPVRSTITQLTNLSTVYNSSYWNAIVRVKIAHNQTGAAINGANVTIRLTGSSGAYVDRTCQTGSTGRCTVTYSPVPNNLSPGTGRVTAVSSNPTWDGVQATVVIARP